MRYGIFSDIHSNLEAFDAVFAAYEKERVDRYLCIGDVVGYAADPCACIAKVKAFASITVAGNHDWAAVDSFSTDYFNAYAKEAIIWTRQNLDQDAGFFLKSLELEFQNEDLTLVHGTLQNPGEFDYMYSSDAARRSLALLKTEVCFLGHTHVAGVFIGHKNGGIEYRQEYRVRVERGNKYIVNVGSVGQPRDGNPDAAYCIYDTAKKEIEIKRAGYDIQGARKKIIAAGLPRYLGDRILEGR